MSAAFPSVFPDLGPPSPPSGMLALSDAGRLSAEMSAAGLGSVEIHRVEGIWRGGVGDAYFEDTEALHGYMDPFRVAQSGGSRAGQSGDSYLFIAHRSLGRLSSFARRCSSRLATVSDVRCWDSVWRDISTKS